jgi:hypothetical protein
MPFITADNVRETSTTSGTGALTLAGAVAGYRRFRDVCSVGGQIDYRVSDGTAWEVGVGTYSGTDTLTRSYIKKSSNSNNAVNFSSNPKDVTATFLADRAAAVNNRNALVNSSFRFWQRGNPITCADGAMGPDGWFVLSESGSVVCSGGTNWYGTGVGKFAIGEVSSTQRVGFGQVLWGTEVYNQNGGEDTWWFQCHADTTSFAVRAAVLYNNTGTADAVVREMVNNWASTTYTAGNFFHANWVPLAVGSANGAGDISFPVVISGGLKNVGVLIWTENQLASGQELTIDEPILSPIGVPQRYSPPDYEAELAACQRRFYKSFEPGVAPVQNVGNGRGTWRFPSYGAGVAHYSRDFPVVMGKTPTIATYNPNAANANWRDLTSSVDRTAGTTGISASGCTITCDTPATALANNAIHVTAEAEPSS